MSQYHFRRFYCHFNLLTDNMTAWIKHRKTRKTVAHASEVGTHSSESSESESESSLPRPITKGSISSMMQSDFQYISSVLLT